jgi:ketosteroid isomerase-like protein
MTGSANVDLVRSIYAAWEHGDYGSAEWAHPDIELVIPDGPDPGKWKGLAGMTATARERLSAFERFYAKAEAFYELDGERVLVLERRSGQGKTSGLGLGELQARGAKLFHIAGGKVVRLVDWWNRDRALADLGLKE